MVDEEALERARKYIAEHRQYNNCSEVLFSDDKSSAVITAEVEVNLPVAFLSKGITDDGVRVLEPVTFHFLSDFPYSAPEIELRKDFPKIFPHINASSNGVFPCVYAGNSSELMQSPDWLDEILNQLTAWLNSAAVHNLMNLEQGWEPMRNDTSNFIVLCKEEDINKESTVSALYVNFSLSKDNIFYGTIVKESDKKNSYGRLIIFETTETITNYIPYNIRTYAELKQITQYLNIPHFEHTIYAAESSDKIKYTFVMLKVKRPVHLIGSNSSTEYLIFAVKRNHSIKKGLLSDDNAEVRLGSIYYDSSSSMMHQLSGTSDSVLTKPILFVGCGSLGSKICLHIARNGNDNIICLDDKNFMPYNKARHALICENILPKAYLLAKVVNSINGGNNSKWYSGSIFKIKSKQYSILIDSTASEAVKNYLIDTNEEQPPIISCFLTNNGKYGFLLAEDRNKNVNLGQIYAHLYWMSLSNEHIHNALFSGSSTDVPIGLTCSSPTMVVDDAHISVFASLMAMKIQTIIENNLEHIAYTYLYNLSDDYSVKTGVIVIPRYVVPECPQEYPFKVSIRPQIIDELKNKMEEQFPRETGGVLVGSYVEKTKEVFITEIVDAPEDSESTPSTFVLGTKGISKEVEVISDKTGKHLMYLGTWHSHPTGGTPSNIDHQTAQRLSDIRGLEPTVCLIVDPNGIHMY
ncbi:MAG: Mov34/MPN/PAD-1 family protein [Treponema sp.]|nr:Mov34/MPN/PAD-1 family protein [Treponema sp.]